MPRQAHGRPVLAHSTSKPRKKKPVKGQFHNALEIAEQQNPTSIKVREHRLGEVEEDAGHSEARADLDEPISKRIKVLHTSSKSDELGSDESGGDPWHIGVNEDDEDSDIDSDEAFDESDEERFADYSFRGSESQVNGKKSRMRRQDETSTRSDQIVGAEMSGESDDEAVDLAQALDMNVEMEKQTQKLGSKEHLHDESDESTTSDAADSESVHGTAANEDDSEQDIMSEVSYSDEEDSGNAKLRRFVQDLRADSEPKDTDGPRATSTATKVTAADMLQYITNPQQRRALRVLANSGSAGPEQYRGGVAGKLEPPLAKRQQDRLDRVAAYEKSKETLNRWIDTVKQNRRAEHLSFPLQDLDSSARLSTKELKSTLQDRPLTSLEATVQQIMQESGMVVENGKDAEAGEQAFEELQEKQMPYEEVQARRAELRKSRNLMFREEIRARRIKKIKSKAYRRVHRKERDKTTQERQAYLTSAGLLDSDEEKQHLDRRRAEERMGARHRESKWAKGVKATGRAAWNEDARNGVSTLARRDDELRRRIEGKTVHQSDESGQESTSESEEADTDGDGAFEGFETRLDSLNGPSELGQRSGLESLTFMQKAQAAKKAANDTDIEKVRQMIRGGSEQDDTDELASIGRLKYGTNAKPFRVAQKVADRSEFEERSSNDEEVSEKLQEREKSAREIEKADAKVPPSARAVRTSQTQTKLPQKIDSEANSRPRNDHAATTGHQQLLDYPSEDSRSETLENTAGLDLNDTVAQAKLLFAGDDRLDQEFQQEKEAIVEEEGDQVIDNTLPGWGSWAGVGISKREQKRAKGRFLSTIKGVPKNKRQDAKLDRVIVNEKRVKKNGKYLASELPHPFESRQQYERSLRLPIGPEWTIKSTFQDATKPRVLLKQGIIRPMAKPMV